MAVENDDQGVRDHVQGPNLTDVSIRRDASLHPDTVTEVSTGQIPVHTPARPRTTEREFAVRRTAIEGRVLATAVKTAGGDHNRLWFDTDGTAWVLNHPRSEQCPSAACPACNHR